MDEDRVINSLKREREILRERFFLCASIMKSHLSSSKHYNNDKILLSIEGNIGSGKTTLLGMIENFFSNEEDKEEDRDPLIHCVREPISLWRDLDGINVLQEYYENPSKYAYMFQSFALVTKLKNQVTLFSDSPSPFIIVERSSLSDHCFAENCYDLGLMNQVEHKVYSQWYDYLISSSHCSSPSLIIYLSTPPEECLKRIKKRAREEEKNISLDYLERLSRKHSQWFSDKEKEEKEEKKEKKEKDIIAIRLDSKFSIPFIELDGMKDFYPNEKTLCWENITIMRRILSMIMELILLMIEEKPIESNE